MTHRATAFGKAVAKLKTPASADFSPAAWDAAYHAHRATISDDRLYDAAQWIGDEAHAGRSATASTVGPELASLTPEWSTILAVAALNREYRTAWAQSEEQRRRARDAGVLAADAMNAERITGAQGQRFSVEDLAELGVDMTENWLFDAHHSSGIGVPTEDLAVTMILATRSYSFRKSLNALWNGAWISGNYCDIGADGISRWLPGDRHRDELFAAWQARQSANLMNFPNIDRTLWPKMTRTHRRRRSRGWGVTHVSDKAGQLAFKVSALTYLSRYMPAYNFERAALEGSYLADFLSAEMLDNPALNVTNLLLAWHAIYDIARLLVNRAPLKSGVSPEQARALALLVRRSLLCDAVARALRISAADADTIVTFLTFRFQTGGKKKDPGNKGLWAAPLVEVPETDELALPLPVLTTSNPARRAEAWLEKGGINDRNPRVSRGDTYEALYRSRVVEAIAGNTKFSNGRAAQNEIKKTKVFGEQIDLLVAFGALCLIGEVKFFLMPADLHERERYDEKLREAAVQAKRKAAALNARRDVIAAHLGISLAEAQALKLLPLIVTAQGYGFSTKVDEVLVVEAEFLRLYLKGDDLVTDRAFVPATGRYTDVSHALYGSEIAAARNFEAVMSKPYVLTRFLDRIKWGETRFPGLVHPDTLIAVPLLDDLRGFERMQAETMIAELGR